VKTRTAFLPFIYTFLSQIIYFQTWLAFSLVSGGVAATSGDGRVVSLSVLLCRCGDFIEPVYLVYASVCWTRQTGAVPTFSLTVSVLVTAPRGGVLRYLPAAPSTAVAACAPCRIGVQACTPTR